MALKIRGNTLVTSRYLKLTKWGVIFVETVAIGGRRKFQFGQIDYVLMSPANVLSFQVGLEVFSIPTKLGKKSHERVIQELVDKVSGSQHRTGGFPVLPQPAQVAQQPW